MIRERNYKKHPHTARFLMQFHTGGNGLAADLPGTEDGGGAVAEDLLDSVPAERPTFMPSERQRQFIADLIREITELAPEAGRNAVAYNRGMTENGRWTPGREGTVSAWIDRLIAKRHELRKAAQETARQARVAVPGLPGVRVAPPVQVTDGMYLMDDTIYKVQVAHNGSGRLYAKRLVRGAEGENATFVYAHGIVTKLRPEHRMTLEQAKEFGALYGTCVRCGRTLTDEFSIANGLGKVCITKI